MAFNQESDVGGSAAVLAHNLITQQWSPYSVWWAGEGTWRLALCSGLPRHEAFVDLLDNQWRPESWFFVESADLAENSELRV